jgi:hypothetical protein
VIFPFLDDLGGEKSGARNALFFLAGLGFWRVFFASFSFWAGER